jgi:uncharacterized protein (DUF488 family)
VVKTVYTIGYEGSGLNPFLATLKNAGVAVVIDIRALPLSRRPGFSKTPLRDALQKEGIEYVHLRGLGNPQKLGAVPGGDFYTMFETHMETEAAQKDLAQAVSIAFEKPSCLLCYELDHKECHRDIVVDHLIRESGQHPIHLRVTDGSVQTAFAL